MYVSLFRISALGLALGLLGFSTIRAGGKKDEPVDLKVGDLAPTFQRPDHAGKPWSSSDRFGKKWVVVYFYPGDFTPGCTAQAKAFNAAMDKLTAKDVEVVGISGDSAKTHDLFRAAQKLSFTLLADEDGTAAKAFGVPFGKGAAVKARDASNKPLEVDGKQYEFERAGTAARWTFVISPDGKVAYKNVKVTPADDAKKIAEFIEAAEKK